MSEKLIAITVDDLSTNKVKTLLEQHLKDMYATSPAESVHALDIKALKAPEITIWRADIDGKAAGCIALKCLTEKHGEIKSMRTDSALRNCGVASALLRHLIAQAKNQGIHRLSLETGTDAFFAPARALYKKHGFTLCQPFGDYQPDPHSTFMTLMLN